MNTDTLQLEWQSPQANKVARQAEMERRTSEHQLKVARYKRHKEVKKLAGREPLNPLAAFAPPHSMRHEHGGGHCAQHAACDAAKHEFPQARMSVAAHHDEIDTLVGRVGE
jgi:hypothetical protein